MLIFDKCICILLKSKIKDTKVNTWITSGSQYDKKIHLLGKGSNYRRYILIAGGRREEVSFI